MPVGELLRRTTSRELTEWMAFYELEPFGPERGDLRAGIVAATVANANRDPKKVKKAFEPQDFMPKFGGEWQVASGEEREEKTPEQLKEKWLNVVKAFKK
jgi:hypothetical protein